MITIKGNPVSWKRPGFKKNGKTYDQQLTEKKMYILQIRPQIGKEFPIKGHVSIEVMFCMKRPKSHYGTGKNAGQVKLSAPYYHEGKEDLDNMCKFLLDCLNKEAFLDDRQVVRLDATKMYSFTPRSEIHIEEIS